mmetsp:Transcript_8197/g.24671  ORF Transcript_8197/g.24671 Transcript_8197/m.24671 type:complete len:156 (-) Transcript_8197:183-650(-)
MAGPTGTVYAVDIQKSAIEQTTDYVESKLASDRRPNLVYCLGSHASFPASISKRSVSAVVYNLGYLPGEEGDRSIVTKKDTTMSSLRSAMELLQPGGLITMTIYVKQDGGEEEEQAILDFTSELDPKEWTVQLYQWINRNQAPSLVAVERKHPAS